MQTKNICAFLGDDASPEVMKPTIELIERLLPNLKFSYPEVGETAQKKYGSNFPDSSKQAIDDSDATFFGSTSGNSTAALFYLRWGKQTFANVRPARWLEGFNSPLADPDGLDFVIIRENLEDLYLGLEGDLEDLAALNYYSRHARSTLSDLGPGKYSIKAITERGSERVIRDAFEMAARRRGKVTLSSKYNMLAVADGLFLETGKRLSKEYPEIEFDHFIIDDFLCRMITDPKALDVVVMPNLYGDIMSDGAAGFIGGLGLAPSGCFGDDYAYFESAHGTAPDIAGLGIINPTATLLSAAMMIDYLDEPLAAGKIRSAIEEVYKSGRALTTDQGGEASTAEFFDAIAIEIQN